MNTMSLRGFFPPRDPDEGDAILARLAPNWHERLLDEHVIETIINDTCFDSFVEKKCSRGHCMNKALPDRMLCERCTEINKAAMARYRLKKKAKAASA